MSTVFKGNPDMLIKLAATNIALTMSVARLMTYHQEIFRELKQDYDFYHHLKNAYVNSSATDHYFADHLADVSAEVDSLLLELNN